MSILFNTENHNIAQSNFRFIEKETTPNLQKALQKKNKVDKSVNFVDNHWELCKSPSFFFHLYCTLSFFEPIFLYETIHEFWCENNASNVLLLYYRGKVRRTFYPRMWWTSYEHTLDQWIVDSSYPLNTGITYPHSK